MDTLGHWSDEKKGKNQLATLRRSLDLYKKEDINNVLITYTQTMCLINAKVPGMTINEKKDWAIANSLSPDWFGDGLTARIQNSMLVSALLLTVTATNFLAPLGNGNGDTSTRLNIYLNGICSILFLTSIFFGVCFIENAMCRAYCWADRFVLIIKMYAVKDISQICAAVGVFLFPITLLVPIQSIYLLTDSRIMYAIFALSIAFFFKVQASGVKGAAAKQNIRGVMLTDMVDETGKLKSQFTPYPEENQTESYQEIFESMYRAEDKMKDSFWGVFKM